MIPHTRGSNSSPPTEFSGAQLKSKMIKNAGASFVIRGGSLLITFVSMPAYIRFFDDQAVLGVWFTLVATLGWVLNFDLGLGNGLRNKLVEALERGETQRARELVSSTYASIGIVIAAVGIFAVFLVPTVDWNALFGVSTSSVGRSVLTTTVGIVLGGLLGQMVLRTVVPIYYALQMAAIPGLLNLVSSSLILATLVWLPVETPEQNIVRLAVANVIASVAPLVIATIIVFGARLRGYAPRFRSVRWPVAKEVLTLGLAFFGVQVLYMLIANSGPILISSLTDASNVVDYQIVSRPFMLVSSLFALALVPVWSAVTAAVSQHDFLWVRKLLRKLYFLALAGSLGMVVMGAFIQAVLDLWLGTLTIQVSWQTAVAFVGSGIAALWAGVVSSIANGLGRLRAQGVMYTLGLGAKAAVSIFGIAVTSSWVCVVWSDVAALAPYVIVQMVAFRRYLGNRSTVVET